MNQHLDAKGWQRHSTPCITGLRLRPQTRSPAQTQDLPFRHPTFPAAPRTPPRCKTIVPKRPNPALPPPSTFLLYRPLSKTPRCSAPPWGRATSPNRPPHAHRPPPLPRLTPPLPAQRACAVQPPAPAPARAAGAPQRAEGGKGGGRRRRASGIHFTQATAGPAGRGGAAASGPGGGRFAGYRAAFPSLWAQREGCRGGRGRPLAPREPPSLWLPGGGAVVVGGACVWRANPSLCLCVVSPLSPSPRLAGRPRPVSPAPPPRPPCERQHGDGLPQLPQEVRPRPLSPPGASRGSSGFVSPGRRERGGGGGRAGGQGRAGPAAPCQQHGPKRRGSPGDPHHQGPQPEIHRPDH